VLARADTAGGRHVADGDGEAVEISGVRYRPGSLLFIDATSEMTSWHLDERFTFWKFDQRRSEWIAISCPCRVATRIVGAATELGFRPCSGFVRVPLFRNGDIVVTQGWDARTRLIVDVPIELPKVPDKPTKNDAIDALERLLRPFRAYLSDNSSLRPALAAAALTAVLRPSLPTAPVILIDGNVIGAGKGKVARALAVLATDGLPAIIAEGHNDEETEKRIATAVLQGASALLFDNLQRTVASSTLESMLTEGVATVRIFGKLADVTVECRALVLMTANNATLRRDMLRRTLPVRIIVPDEKPELRRFDFDPVDEARRDRAELLIAAFTVARAWHAVRDLPENSRIRAKTLGSFETWADLVAGATHWLTGANPIDAIEAKKGEDPAAMSERAIITSLFEAFDGGSFTAAEAASKVDPATWREAINFKAERPDGRVVGNWLQRRRDRSFNIIQVAGKSPLLVTLKVSGVDRKGFTHWTITRESQKSAIFERRTAEPAEPDSMQPREKCQTVQTVKNLLTVSRNWGEAGSARFGGSAGRNEANGADRERIGDCAYCRDAAYADDAKPLQGGRVLHHRCADLWSGNFEEREV
jgi:putative DNA primase/helicase